MNNESERCGNTLKDEDICVIIPELTTGDASKSQMSGEENKFFIGNDRSVG
jgi:hypothetical protein